MYITQENVYDYICWSADVPDLETLLGHLRRMSKLRVIKIDRAFVERNGFEVFAVLANEFPWLRVFYDAKYIEIPPKMADLAEVGCSHKTWMVNCMANALSNGEYSPTAEEKDGLKRFADVCHKHGVLPCGVSVLTTKSDEMTEAEYSKGRTSQVLFYAEQFVKAGFTDMVCSPQELRALNDIFGCAIRFVTPGVRLPDAAKDDQVNADTPSVTLGSGSDLLVIGRPITIGNPPENLEKIAAEILQAA